LPTETVCLDQMNPIANTKANHPRKAQARDAVIRNPLQLQLQYGKGAGPFFDSILSAFIPTGPFYPLQKHYSAFACLLTHDKPIHRRYNPIREDRIRGGKEGERGGR